MSPKGPGVEGLVSRVVQLGDGGILERFSQVGGFQSLGLSFLRGRWRPGPPLCSLLFPGHEVRGFALPHVLTMMCCPHHRHKATRPMIHGMKPPNL